MLLQKAYKALGSLLGVFVGILLVIEPEFVSETVIRIGGGALLLFCAFHLLKIILPYVGKKVFRVLGKELE